MNRDKRFLRFNRLLPLTAGVLLVISIIFLATPRPFAEPEIIEIFARALDVDMRLLQLKFLLPLSVGVLLVISFARARSTPGKRTISNGIIEYTRIRRKATTGLKNGNCSR